MFLRSHSVRFLILWLAFAISLAQANAAEFKTLAGDTYSGQLASATDDGIIVRLDIGGLSPRIDYSKLTDETLKLLSEDPRSKRFAEPFLAPPAEEKIFEEAKQITISKPPRVDRPETRSGLLAALTSTNGLILLGVLFAANLFAAFAVARYRWRPAAVVCGLSAVLPVIGPLVFLALPKAEEVSEGETVPTDPTSVPMAASAGENRVSSLGGVKSATPAAGAERLPRSFPRGEFTYNKRFFETQFPTFFRVVPSEADKDLVIDISAGKKSTIASRISRISQNEIHFKTANNQEIGVEYHEINGITLRHKDQKA